MGEGKPRKQMTNWWSRGVYHYWCFSFICYNLVEASQSISWPDFVERGVLCYEVQRQMTLNRAGLGGGIWVTGDTVQWNSPGGKMSDLDHNTGLSFLLKHLSLRVNMGEVHGAVNVGARRVTVPLGTRSCRKLCPKRHGSRQTFRQCANFKTKKYARFSQSAFLSCYLSFNLYCV